MAIQLIGNGGFVADVDGTNWRGVRVTQRPPEYGSGGYYRTSFSALTAAAPGAAAQLASLRWTSGSLLMAIHAIYQTIAVSTASTVGLPQLGCYVARSFSAGDSGGTAVTLTGSSFKTRTSMATTVLGDMRYASAGVITAGTRTLDSQPILSVVTNFALGSTNSNFMDNNGPYDHPIILAQNEGLVWQNVTAVTSGVYQYTVHIEWAEVASF